ncbi:WhiB family transcriptional regulator [Micromonospora sp. NPDC048935]|uniref:WhiB family transcriptional regulator n=1 Tax=Micromonospora sp. NPDC048935 TaxID=3364262 RepID=UPI00372186D8
MTSVAVTPIPSRRLTVLPCAADPEKWYDGSRNNDAKAGCKGCPARGSCLALALETDEPWGVWGGYTATERQRLASGRTPLVCRGCGQDCVPDQPHHARCDRCNTGPDGRNVDDDREQIARLAADGWTDRRIANRLGWTVNNIKGCRSRHNIPSAYPNGGGGHWLAATTATNLKPCGTSAAFRRHKRRGEPIDEACRQANARSSADERQAKAARALAGRTNRP